MLTPTYLFTNDFTQFYEYFLTQPHKKKTFHKGEYLWEPGEPFQSIHYIISGLTHNYLEHETGRRKIISFHGEGTVFPGYHQHDFRIEQSLITKAIYDIEVLEFTKDEFKTMMESNPKLNASVVEWFSMYTNLLLYDMAHQEYNNSFLKLCNLLYLISSNGVKNDRGFVHMTQEDLSDILGMSRVNLTRCLSQLRNEQIVVTHRKYVEIIDPEALVRHCSLETV